MSFISDSLIKRPEHNISVNSFKFPAHFNRLFPLEGTSALSPGAWQPFVKILFYRILRLIIVLFSSELAENRYSGRLISLVRGWTFILKAFISKTHSISPLNARMRRRDRDAIRSLILVNVK